MKLNNKGFAITGILYTLLVIFLISLISLLSELNTRKKIMEKSVETMEDKYEFIRCGNKTTSQEAPETGKYIFLKNSASEERCYTYIPKGASINPNKLQYTTASCNEETDKENFTLLEYCKK